MYWDILMFGETEPWRYQFENEEEAQEAFEYFKGKMKSYELARILK